MTTGSRRGLLGTVAQLANLLLLVLILAGVVLVLFAVASIRAKLSASAGRCTA
jgi:hypothetical protein